LLGGCGLDSTGLGQGPVAGCCECGDEPLGSCVTELVIYIYIYIYTHTHILHYLGIFDTTFRELALIPSSGDFHSTDTI
jgi:hypothetical protein